MDALAFEHFCSMFDSSSPSILEMLADSIQHLIRLYPGHFLTDEEAPWAITTRERLRSKFLRMVNILSQRLQHADTWQQVSTLFQHALETDPLIERSDAKLPSTGPVCRSPRGVPPLP